MTICERAQDLGAAPIAGSPVVGAFFFFKFSEVPLGLESACLDAESEAIEPPRRQKDALG